MVPIVGEPTDTKAAPARSCAPRGPTALRSVHSVACPRLQNRPSRLRLDLRLPQEAWDEFLDLLDRPDNERLAALREHTPDWGAARA